MKREILRVIMPRKRDALLENADAAEAAGHTIPAYQQRRIEARRRFGNLAEQAKATLRQIQEGRQTEGPEPKSDLAALAHKTMQAIRRGLRGG